MKYKIILSSLLFALFHINVFAQKDSLQAVDLGLSVKWANMNVNAMEPDDAGIYCAWGGILKGTRHLLTVTITYHLALLCLVLQEI